MKKFIIAFMIVLVSACTLGKATTPREIVTEFLDKYKNQNQEILTQLDETINQQISNNEQKDKYRTLMKNQYKNMEYKIKDEIIEDDNAVIEVEVTVYDYASAIKKSNTYLNEHLDEFKKDEEDISDDVKDTAKDIKEGVKESIDDIKDAVDNDNNQSSDTKTNNNSKTNEKNTTNSYDNDKFMDYKISEMEKVKDTIKYTIEFTLTKVNNEWQLDSLSNSDIEKIHGIYIS